MCIKNEISCTGKKKDKRQFFEVQPPGMHNDADEDLRYNDDVDEEVFSKKETIVMVLFISCSKIY